MEKLPDGELEILKKKLTEAIAYLERYHRADNAAYILFTTEKDNCIAIADKLLKVELLEGIDTIKNEMSLFSLLHTPKNIAQSFLSYRKYWANLDQEAIQIGKDLLYILGAEQEERGRYSNDPGKEGAAYYYRIAGYEEEAKSVEMKQDVNVELRLSVGLDKTTVYKKAIQKIKTKYTNLIVPTKTEKEDIYRDCASKIKDILTNL